MEAEVAAALSSIRSSLSIRLASAPTLAMQQESPLSESMQASQHSKPASPLNNGLERRTENITDEAG